MATNRLLREYIHEVVIAGEYGPDDVTASLRPADASGFLGMKQNDTDASKRYLGMTKPATVDDETDDGEATNDSGGDSEIDDEDDGSSETTFTATTTQRVSANPGASEVSLDHDEA